MNDLEKFLHWMFNEGWEELEDYFYNSTEEEWVEKALESYRKRF